MPDFQYRMVEVTFACIDTACRERKKAATAATDLQSSAAPAEKVTSKEVAEDASAKLSFGRIELDRGTPQFSQLCVHLVLELAAGTGRWTDKDCTQVRKERL